MANPIILENTADGTKYTLEFTRNTVKMAEKAGFTLESITDGKIISGYSDLFYYAFMAHHRYMKQFDTDKILFEELGGMSEALSTRLVELFAEPYNSLVKQDKGDEKNAKWSVQL